MVISPPEDELSDSMRELVPLALQSNLPTITFASTAEEALESIKISCLVLQRLARVQANTIASEEKAARSLPASIMQHILNDVSASNVHVSTFETIRDMILHEPPLPHPTRAGFAQETGMSLNKAFNQDRAL